MRLKPLANGFASSRKLQKAVNLRRLELGGQTVKNLRRLAYEFELNQSQRKSSQVGGQTKRKLSARRKLTFTRESVWTGLYNAAIK